LKKLVALLVVLAAFLSLNNNTAFSQPQLKVHVTGGYNVPLPDLKGDLLDSADQVNTLGMKSGFNAGADVKYYLGKKRNVGITLGLTYNSFSNSADSTSYSVKSTLNDFSVGLGIEYSFIPKGKTQPYLGLEFTGNFFSGDGTFTPSVGTEQKYTLISASRFGIAIGGGIDFAFSKSVGANIGVKYHMANLIGKDYDTTTTLGSTEFPLNDKEYTSGSFTSPAKNISYIQLSAGLSFFFNHPKKVAKK
jgi:outer membrane protein W